MKIVTILGTRPEIIRLSILIEKLDRAVEHRLVHTGQNFDPALSDRFFAELGVRAPDLHLGIRAESFGEQVGRILAAADEVLRRERPDRLLVLGDTNSGLSALVAKRLGIPVVHLEAGNRCFDDRVPEEVNRRVIDHASDVLLPYTERSRANLLAEGIEARRVFVVGNPITEVLRRHEGRTLASDVHARIGVERGGYALATVHRAENVDDPERLRLVAAALDAVQRELGVAVVVSTHPRLASRIDGLAIRSSAGVRFLPPFGFHDFVALERHARCVLTDSGTVQEECCILRVPNVTLRDVTERPETIECGSNVLAGVTPEAVVRGVRLALGREPSWTPPAEYLREDVSDACLGILLSGGRS